jgi:hypothetical protein
MPRSEYWPNLISLFGYLSFFRAVHKIKNINNGERSGRRVGQQAEEAFYR